MLRRGAVLAACALLAGAVNLVAADNSDGDSMAPGYVDEVSAPLGSPTYENAIQTDPLKGYYHGQDTSNHLANSGALVGYPRELFKLDLALSNDNAAIILTVSWAALALLAVTFTFVKVPPDAGPASLTAILAAGIGLSATYLTWPQAQQNAALGAFATAQTAALGWMQTRHKIYIIAGVGNAAAAFVGTLVVITTAQPYIWSPGHDPAIYCIIAWALLVVSTISGICSTLHAPPTRLFSRFRRFNILLIAGFNALTGLVASVVAIVASAKFVTPYVACMVRHPALSFLAVTIKFNSQLIYQAIGVAAVMALSVFGVVAALREEADHNTEDQKSEEF